jgi:hypothetical protein
MKTVISTEGAVGKPLPLFSVFIEQINLLLAYFPLHVVLCKSCLMVSDLVNMNTTEKVTKETKISPSFYSMDCFYLALAPTDPL